MVGRNLPPFNTRQPQLWRHAKAASPPTGIPLPGGHGAAPGRLVPGQSGHAPGCQRSIGPRLSSLPAPACASLGAKVLISRGLWTPSWGTAGRPRVMTFHPTELMFDRTAILPSPAEVLASTPYNPLRWVWTVQTVSNSKRSAPSPRPRGKTAGNSGIESNLHKFVNRIAGNYDTTRP